MVTACSHVDYDRVSGATRARTPTNCTTWYCHRTSIVIEAACPTNLYSSSFFGMQQHGRDDIYEYYSPTSGIDNGERYFARLAIADNGVCWKLQETQFGKRNVR